ncbi:MAG: hypothetical protein OEL20_17445 [Sulfuritalea sp.]|nr:hypothetical protein [Sulfuritalea sp.]
MRELWPPLSLIEERLSPKAGVPDAQGAADSVHLNVTDEPAPAPEVLSALVGERIRQIDAARLLRVDQLRPGLIVLVDTAAICLNRPTNKTETSWAGWVAAPDTEYATEADVLLEPDDEPFDPFAVMVQTWNPVQISLPKNPRVLAMLTPARLDVLRAVAAEGGRSTQDDAAHPGFVFLRGTDSGQPVLTGTPLGGQDDPRHAYQHLYREFAGSLRSAPTAQAEGASFWQRVGDWIGQNRPQAYGMAATAIVAVVVVGLLRETDSDSGSRAVIAQAPAPESRSPADPASTRPPAESQSLPSGLPPPPRKADISQPVQSAPMKDKPSLGPTQLADAEKVTVPEREDEAGSPQVRKRVATRKIPFDSAGNPAPTFKSDFLVARDEMPLTETFAKDSQGRRQHLYSAVSEGLGAIQSLGVQSRVGPYKVFRIRIAAPDRIDAALDFLEAQGFQIMRVTADGIHTDVAIETKRLDVRLDEKLRRSGYFVAP